MINDAIGKILGMAMAYGVSSLGLFLAYVNYRKRIVKAEKVMTGTAWTVIVVIVLAVVAGVIVISDLAQAPGEVAAGEAAAVEAVAAPAPEAPPSPPPQVAVPVEPGRWPLVGIVLPAIIFLLATWVTAALYKHFASHGHGGPATGDG